MDNRAVAESGFYSEIWPAESRRELAAQEGLESEAELQAWMIQRAAEAEDAAALEDSLRGEKMPDSMLPLLIKIFEADWHCRHEDVASTIADMETVAAVPVLFRAATWTPLCLAWDDLHGLGKNACHWLGRIQGPEARTALERLVRFSPIEAIRDGAQAQLDRRGEMGRDQD